MNPTRYVALDLETTGLNPAEDSIIEIGAVLVENGSVLQEFTCMVNPGIPIPARITEITGIDDGMVAQAGTIAEALEQLTPLIQGEILLGHNIGFDYSFLKKAYADQHIDFKAAGIDTYRLAKKRLPELPQKSLEALSRYFQIKTTHHRALADAVTASEVYQRMEQMRDDTENDSCDVMELTYRLPKKEPVTAKQIKFLKDLYARYHLKETRPFTDYSKSEASKEIDRILSAHGAVGRFRKS